MMPRDRLNEEMTALRDTINQKLSRHEQVSRIVLVKEPWTQEAGFLTPTLKLKRHVIEKRYEGLLQQTAQNPAPVLWES